MGNKIIDFSKFAELKPRQTIVGSSERVGMFVIKSANQALTDASKYPDSIPLWKSFWYLGKVSCLFSDSNLGKSILAVQIATEIAKDYKVLLFDFELSEKQFQMRYTGEFGNIYNFPSNLYRVEIDKDNLDVNNYYEDIIQNIEQTAIQMNASILIIDNLTYLCLDSEKGRDAGELMLRFMTLKKKHNLSILVLAHTPKRNLKNPITQNDLAGSKRLFNFFDSAFAIGLSAQDSKLRYIKQIKVRYGECIYHDNNVILAKIIKSNSFLYFDEIGFAIEREHLKEKTDDDPELIERIKELKEQGMSYEKIGTELGIGRSKAWRLVNN